MMISQLQLNYKGVVISKKNSKIIRKDRRTGRNYITSNDAAKRNEADMIWSFKEQLAGAFTAEDLCPCSVAVTIYEPDAHRRDLDNQLTSILDALVRAGVITDDSNANVYGVSVRYGGIDRENPRADIVITKESEGAICQ